MSRTTIAFWPLLQKAEELWHVKKKSLFLSVDCDWMYYSAAGYKHCPPARPSTTVTQAQVHSYSSVTMPPPPMWQCLMNELPCFPPSFTTGCWECLRAKIGGFMGEHLYSATLTPSGLYLPGPKPTLWAQCALTQPPCTRLYPKCTVTV